LEVSVALNYKTKVMVLLFLSFWAEIVSSHPAPKAAVSIAISVFNDAGIADAVLVQAEARAAQIMGQAGVRVDWLNCDRGGDGFGGLEAPLPADCLAIRFPEHLSVRVVGHPLAASEDIFGQSFLDASGQGCYAVIYHANFQSLGSESPLSDAQVLGHVIAHEVGHLLLGINSHSALGLMRAHWDPRALEQAAKGNLLFTPAQAATMRERLASFGTIAAKIPPGVQTGR
jgi:hypothetical protein